MTRPLNRVGDPNRGQGTDQADSGTPEITELDGMRFGSLSFGLFHPVICT
jgi:hypothetical protein